MNVEIKVTTIVPKERLKTTIDRMLQSKEFVLFMNAWINEKMTPLNVIRFVNAEYGWFYDEKYGELDGVTFTIDNNKLTAYLKKENI